MAKVYIVIHSKNKDNVYGDRIPSSVCLNESVAFSKAVNHVSAQLNNIKAHNLENGHREGFETMNRLFSGKDHHNSAVLSYWNSFVSSLDDMDLEYVHVYEKELE